jgi:uncharacterized protein with HEPN domain
VPPRKWRLRVADILGCIERIEGYVAGMTYGDFEHDDRTYDAVLMNLAIVGEAAGHVDEELTARHPSVPWDKMRAMRNVIVHEYFGASRRIVWETIAHDLPSLSVALEAMLEDEAPRR